jgi:hypothetical protein
MYPPTLQQIILNTSRCPYCGNTGNLNIERQEILDGNLKKVGAGKLVYHCRNCGCNTPVATKKVPQQTTQVLPIKTLYQMSTSALEVYKVTMSLAAMRSANELEREQYRQAMERVNMVINNKYRGRGCGL